jgi:hypothetical protein
MTMFMKTKYFEGSFWCSNAEGVAKILDAQKGMSETDERGDEKLSDENKMSSSTEEEKDVEKDCKTPSRL